MAPPLLHVLGGGPWQLRTIRHARARGLRVLVTDGRADAPGLAEADLQARADLADAEATLAVARAHAADGVLCDTTDTGVVTAAVVAEALGLPGPGVEAARRCCDKQRMADAARAAGLPVPAAHLLTGTDALPDDLPLPAIVKPTDSQSGRGVSIVQAAHHWRDALAEARAYSRSGRVLVQALLQGPEFIVDSLVIDGHPTVLGVASKRPYADNPTIASHITYGDADAGAHSRLVDANTRLITALGLRQGLVHAEFIDADAGPVPIDVAARGGGVLIYPVVLSHVAGLSLMDAAIDLALGQPVTRPVHPQGRGAQIRFLRAKPGRIRGISGLDAAAAVPGIAAVHLNQQVGDITGSLRHKDQRLGFVVALGDDAAAAQAAAEAAVACICIDIE